VPWHQDASFWKLSPARTVTVWLAIDDADEENAAMRFIPGTHDKGEIETSRWAKDASSTRASPMPSNMANHSSTL
jgi:ectoine hydroxylase-related dioxygenase (phytanoyl-CoA dioxygenase family)